MAAQELQVIGSGETLSAADSTTFLDRLAKLRAWLIEEGLCYWVETDIPDAVCLPLAKILAGESQAAFGVNYDKGAEGLIQLRRHVSRRTSGEPGQADYF